MKIDERHRILAVNPCNGHYHRETDGILLPAGDPITLKIVVAYKPECEALGCGEEHIHSVELLAERIRQYQGDMAFDTVPVIDRKYVILATNRAGSTYDETSGVFFSAADKALLPALKKVTAQYAAEINTPLLYWKGLIERIEDFQQRVRSKVPDTNTSCEIERCIRGKGL